VVVFVWSVAAVVVFVTEAPASDALVVVTTEPALRIAFDRVTDRLCLIRVVTAVVVAVAAPLRRYADLQHSNIPPISLQENKYKFLVGLWSFTNIQGMSKNRRPFSLVLGLAHDFFSRFSFFNRLSYRYFFSFSVFLILGFYLSHPRPAVSWFLCFFYTAVLLFQFLSFHLYYNISVF